MDALMRALSSGQDLVGDDAIDSDGECWYEDEVHFNNDVLDTFVNLIPDVYQSRSGCSPWSHADLFIDSSSGLTGSDGSSLFQNKRELYPFDAAMHALIDEQQARMPEGLDWRSLDPEVIAVTIDYAKQHGMTTLSRFLERKLAWDYWH